ncbi:MAG: hypothetical protein AAFP90_14615 [Planctomycetota bacterium]
MTEITEETPRDAMLRHVITLHRPIAVDVLIGELQLVAKYSDAVPHQTERQWQQTLQLLTEDELLRIVDDNVFIDRQRVLSQQEAQRRQRKGLLF